MKFYTLNEVPIQNDDLVFKASPIVAGISFTVILAITIAAVLLGIHHVDGFTAPPVICYIVAAFAGLFGWFAFHSFRASLKPSNWLLRCNRRGVIIHFRSYANWRFPAEDVQAVGFDYSEIAWARTVKERCISPSLGGNNRIQAQQLTFLKLELVNTDTAEFEQNLQREMNLRPEGIMIELDYPVQVKPDGIVELRWSNISPSAHKAIKHLSKYVKITEADARQVNLTHQSNLLLGTEDDKILELAKSGDEMGALALTRQAYGCSLKEAKDFVQKLRGR